MARRGRPTVEINLTGDERKTLERWARRHSSSHALALRCRIGGYRLTSGNRLPSVSLNSDHRPNGMSVGS